MICVGGGAGGQGGPGGPCDLHPEKIAAERFICVKFDMYNVDLYNFLYL
jgi:hypothetical protein